MGVGQPVAPSSAPTQDEQTKRPGDPQNTFSIRIMNLDITYADYAPASRSTFASLILRHTGILVAQAMTYHKWHARGRSETYVVFAAVAIHGKDEQLIKSISTVACWGNCKYMSIGLKAAAQSS